MADLPEWAPSACTLPTEERPLRVAEFDELFATALRSVDRAAPDRVVMVMDAGVAEQAADLMARESQCCSFFKFDLARRADVVSLTIEVPATYVPVLDALTARAVTAAGLTG
jgi:hypothetical protein